MLEDDPDRLEQFGAILARDFPRLAWRHWRSASGFIEGYSRRESDPLLICLDHDLIAESPDEPDLGDGRDVADFLAGEHAICPVLIHSTNVPAANSMRFALEDACWKVEKVTPTGQDWIEVIWVGVVRRLLGSVI